MFVPEAYITATRQFVAQANNWSLEELTLEVTSFFFSFFFLFFAFSSFPPHTPLYFSFVFFSCLCLKKTLLRIVQYLYLVKGGVPRLMFIVGLFIVNVTKVTFLPMLLPIVLHKRSLQ